MRRAVFLLTPLLILLAAACGGGEKAAQETQPAGPVTITFWHSMTVSNEDTLKALVQTFNSSQNEVTVNLVFQGIYDESLNKFLASLGRPSELPAIIQIEDASTQLMVDSKEITPVQDFIDREKYDLSNFEPRVLDYYRVGDRLYSMPFNLSSPILYYNKIDFREVGLDPEKPPQTLEDVKAYSQKLLQKDSSGNITRSGIALDVVPWDFEEWLAKAGALYVNNGNGRDARATEAVFNGPEGKAIFEWWADMVKSGLAFNVGRNPSGADGLFAIASGRASMTITTSAALRSVFDALEAGVEGVELGVGPMPAPQSPDGGISVAGASLWIIKSRPEAEQEAAWKFIKFLVEPAQQATWYAGSGYFPIRRDAFDEPAAKAAEAKYPYLRVAPQEFQEGARNRATQGFLLGPFSKIRSEIIAPAIESMILTNTPPDEALDKAASDATQAIKEYNQRLKG
jgi:sn-glycerol 3-phosphate transport system substrate-binding protein